MVATFGEAGANSSIGHCACLRRELSGEPDVGNLHLRFDEGRGTFSVPSYSTFGEGMASGRTYADRLRDFGFSDYD